MVRNGDRASTVCVDLPFSEMAMGQNPNRTPSEHPNLH